VQNGDLASFGRLDAQILVVNGQADSSDENRGICSGSSFTREAAGWMRSSSASKSRPFSPAKTISPSATQRSDSICGGAR
jgi:hypothetical protein